MILQTTISFKKLRIVLVPLPLHSVQSTNLLHHSRISKKLFSSFFTDNAHLNVLVFQFSSRNANGQCSRFHRENNPPSAIYIHILGLYTHIPRQYLSLQYSLPFNLDYVSALLQMDKTSIVYSKVGISHLCAT